MSDLRAVWIADPAAPGFGGADLILAGPSLAPDRDLDTAVILSLFTDARARPDDPLPFPGASRRGWWGDGLLADRDDRYGSRLWLLAREKQTTETLNRARTYAEEALAWLLEDGVASAVGIEAEWAAPGLLGLRVRIEKPESGTFARRYDFAWDQIEAA